MIHAGICTIGDEILIGQIVDTNSSAIATELEANGIKVRRMVSFGDERHEIMSNLENELHENDIVIVTGGLGPTKDDITKKVLFELSGSTSYVRHEGQLEVIHKILSSRGLDVLEINRDQALVPDRCEVIVNRFGTAPIMIFRFESSRFGHPAVLYSLPGVPYEALGALPDVLADIKSHFQTEDIYHKSIRTFGLAESALAELIAPWEAALPEDMHLAYLPNLLKGVTLRLSIFGGKAESQAERCEAVLKDLRGILGDKIYSEEDEGLEIVVGRLLRNAGMTLSCAESCTGGLIASLITSVPGASEYFLGGVVSYANSVKAGVLGVPSEILENYGAVSEECVREMAAGVRRLTGSDFAVATSGIAGPGGGSEEKPVGMVWVSVCSKSRCEAAKFVFSHNRQRNIQRFAASALDFLRKFIISEINR